ncbi:hypothetical protein M427DRAFT_407621 [Gonapodya prolifera JEL478]|uniref:Uncharacterized protein n=1 Tax=Gonapodya prolifera (strain JEL478) TaxID=1344416 RepID=A0A139AUF0_GONPJ|nr:hypothetical protein M427DRAFT_407621 [Gonapodya prolifera JEL478]|eukprot:KXS20337.1 hypothetical protein M427DRAFT_407621 [Gonapodya prolifera JEL478]
MRLHAILVFTLLICASASAERILELFIRPASSSTLLHRGTITVTGLEPSSKPSARFEEATTKDMEQPTSGVIVAVLKDEETGEQWTSRVKTCSTTKPEQAVIHVDAEGHLYHFDFYLDCKAKSSKGVSTQRTSSIFIIRCIIFRSVHQFQSIDLMILSALAITESRRWRRKSSKRPHRMSAFSKSTGCISCH